MKVISQLGLYTGWKLCVPKLKNDGSILIIIRAHQKDGEVASGAQKGDGANWNGAV